MQLLPSERAHCILDFGLQGKRERDKSTRYVTIVAQLTQYVRVHKFELYAYVSMPGISSFRDEKKSVRFARSRFEISECYARSITVLKIVNARDGILIGNLVDVVLISEMATSSRSASKAPQRTYKKQEIAALADTGDRFKLLEYITPRVPLGTRWFSDTAKVGPANMEKCKVAIDDWDKHVESMPADGRCKGMFMSSFGRIHSARRCEVATNKNLCGLCSKMRAAAKSTGDPFVTPDGQQEYVVVSKALFSRPGVKENIQYWESASTELRKKHTTLADAFPYFSSQEIVEMLMMDSLVIFKGGGRGGRTHTRSEVIVDAQDEFVRVCLKCVLVILRFEERMHFQKRWKAITRIAQKIHMQSLLQANEKGDLVGAIQAADIIREELSRASEHSVKEHQTARHLSIRTKRLGDWAGARRQKASSSASPDSVSSSSPTMPKEKSNAGAAPLEFKRVPTTPCPKQTQPTEGESADVKDPSKAQRQNREPSHKKFSVRKSNIPGAGRGLFLEESAKDGERIGRYSGTVLNKKEAEASDSERIVRVSEDVFSGGKRRK